jgi:hypothetical protein
MKGRICPDFPRVVPAVPVHFSVDVSHTDEKKAKRMLMKSHGFRVKIRVSRGAIRVLGRSIRDPIEPQTFLPRFLFRFLFIKLLFSIIVSIYLIFFN